MPQIIRPQALLFCPSSTDHRPLNRNHEKTIVFLG
jgi:hypothetical protein